MYRRNCRSCCMNNYKDDMIEKKCNNVPNTISYKDECDCGFEEEEDVFPTDPMFGQSYVPYQIMGKTFKPSVGLKMGTIFPELISPYMPGQSMEENIYLEETNTIGKGCNKCPRM